MATTLTEVHTSRDLTANYADSSGRWEYVARVTGEAEPENAAGAAALVVAPFYWLGMARQSATVTPMGGDYYRVVLNYGFDATGQAGVNANAPDPTYSPGAGSGPGGGSPSATPTGPPTPETPIGGNVTLEIGGKPPKLYKSRLTYAKGGINGVTATDYKGLIAVQPDGKVEGAEIPEPVVVGTQDFTFDSVSWKYLDRLAQLVWHTNDAPFYHFAAHEVCFIGASVKWQADGRVNVSMRFGIDKTEVIKKGAIRDDDAAPGTDDLPNADVDRPGWHHLWVAYRSEFDPVTKRKAERPFEFFIEQMLPTADFADLGVGT